MALFTRNELLAKAAASSVYTTESYIREDAIGHIKASNAKIIEKADRYDIFLSHSFEDARLVRALRDELMSQGYTVYVDWIDDPLVDRTRVDKFSAELLRLRMRMSRSLLYATSESSSKSLWMPWELGYMDGRTNSRVAIVPIVHEADSIKEFKGVEYLSIYPYLDKTGANLYIHRSIGKWTNFSKWIAGEII